MMNVLRSQQTLAFENQIHQNKSYPTKNETEMDD